MGDLANMTDNDGRVNGFRLLRWLRNRAETYRLEKEFCSRRGLPTCAAMNRGRSDMLSEMADDLERELTPPDYPEDSSPKAPWWPCQASCSAGEDRTAGGERAGDAVLGDLRTCPDCGAQHNAGSHVDGCCPGCVGRRIRDLTEDGVDLDDKDTGPCEVCGQLADRVPVRDNGRVFFACPACAARTNGDGVDLDDPALTNGPEGK